MALVSEKKKGVLREILGKIRGGAKSLGDSYNALYKKKSDEFLQGYPVKGESASPSNVEGLMYYKNSLKKMKKMSDYKNLGVMPNIKKRVE